MHAFCSVRSSSSTRRRPALAAATLHWQDVVADGDRQADVQLAATRAIGRPGHGTGSSAEPIGPRATPGGRASMAGLPGSVGRNGDVVAEGAAARVGAAAALLENLSETAGPRPR